MGTTYCKRDRDGMAIIGRTKFALRGIRFADGEDGDEPNNSETPDEPTDNVEDSATAKVAVLTAQLADRDVTIADLSAQVVAAKAANYDLLMQIPGNEPVVADEPSDESDKDIEDLFGED